MPRMPCRKSGIVNLPKKCHIAWASTELFISNRCKPLQAKIYGQFDFFTSQFPRTVRGPVKMHSSHHPVLTDLQVCGLRGTLSLITCSERDRGCLQGEKSLVWENTKFHIRGLRCWFFFIVKSSGVRTNRRETVLWIEIGFEVCSNYLKLTELIIK